MALALVLAAALYAVGLVLGIWLCARIWRALRNPAAGETVGERVMYFIDEWHRGC